jgi:hypothetical protein
MNPRWSDTGSGGNHNVIRVGVFFGHEHDLSGGAGHVNFGPGLVSQKVGADALLGGSSAFVSIVPVGGTTDAKTSSLSGHIVSVTGRGDRTGPGLRSFFRGHRG